MLDEVTHEEALYVKQRTGKPIRATIAEFYKNLTQIMATFNVNDVNLEYQISAFPERTLTVKLLGQSSFQIGQVPESELERKERYAEIALSIAEHNGKSIRTTEGKTVKEKSK
jgi:hypothetical protein